MNIAIAGFGTEGASSYRYYTNRGDTVTILRQRDTREGLPEDASVILGNDAFSDLGGYDMVLRSPSLPPHQLSGAKKIWTTTNEFFARCPAPIIGVTGTKGKGTTSSLIAAILKEAGKTVHLVGNIGTPALDELESIAADDIVVFELSSFQLWDLQRSPHVGVVLMIEPDHLNVHIDFDGYVAAKGHIAEYQNTSDTIIYHPTNEASAWVASLSKGTRKRYLTPEAADVRDDTVMMGEVAICPVSEVGLRGAYNLENVCAAVSAAWLFSQDAAAFKRAIQEFKGLEHRLEFVAKKRGISFYNDSFSSAPIATLGAITAFTEPVVLIAGGYDRGINLQPLAEGIAKAPAVHRVLLIGQIRERLAEALAEQGFDRYEMLDETDMRRIVELAAAAAPENGVVLLSPGCASFDMFKNFYERGRAFKQAVGELDG